MAVVTRLFEAPELRFTPEDLRVIEALLFASRRAAGGGRARRAAAARLRRQRRRWRNCSANTPGAACKWCGSPGAGCSAPRPTWPGCSRKEDAEKKKLSRAAVETLAIVAYHQPVTRAEIEDIRGVAVSKGALDVLMEAGWVRLRGRRKAPGRPITYGTTHKFLIHFGLEQIADLPGLDELQGAGLFEGKLPPGYGVPRPDDGEALRADEEPLDPSDTLTEAWGPIRRDPS